MTKPEELARRIELAYMASTGRADPRGARAWFAREAGISPRHVSRLLGGQRAVGGPVLRVLDLLERRG